MNLEIARAFNRLKEPTIEDMELCEIVRNLIEFCTERAHKEEGLMRLEGYPKVEEHELAHQALQDLLVQNVKNLLKPESRKEALAVLEKAFLVHLLQNLDFENWMSHYHQH